MIATPIILELIIDAPIELKPYVSGCIIGPQGDSAYKIAVDNGFIGTEQDWLDSLVGANGADGKDAYESYLETTSDSPVLTEAQWSASFEIDWATNLDMSQGTSTVVAVNPLQFNYGFGYNSLNVNFDDLDTTDKTIIGSINELKTPKKITLDAVNPEEVTAVGELAWNNIDKTVDIKTPFGTIQVNQEQQFIVRNHNTYPLYDGQLIRIIGYNGTHYLVDVADNSTFESARWDGMLTCDIPAYTGSNDEEVMGAATVNGFVREKNTSTCNENDDVYLGKAGAWTCTKPTAPDYVRKIGKIGAVSATDGEIYVRWTDTSIGDIEQELEDMNMPHGIPLSQKALINLSYDYTTRTITVTGEHYYYWKSKKVIVTTTPQNEVHADTKATYFLCYTESGLTFSTTPFIFGECVPIAIITYNNKVASTFWTGPQGKLLCERHGSVMDKKTHEEFHNVIGCYALSGFAATGYSEATGTGGLTANTFSIDGGNIYDEDNKTLLPTLVDNNGVGAHYNVYYKDGNGDFLYYKNNLPYLFTATNILYNPITAGLGALTQIINNGRYMNIFVAAAPVLDLTTGLPTEDGYCFIVGQNQYTSLALAQGESIYGLDLTGFPSAEVAFLYQVTFRRETSYDDNGNCRIESFRRLVGTRFSNATLSGGSNIHNNLANRDAIDAHPISSITDLQTELDNKVDGPSTSTDNAIARFDGITGKLIQNSKVTINDAGNLGINVPIPEAILHIKSPAVLGTTLNNNILIRREDNTIGASVFRINKYLVRAIDANPTWASTVLHDSISVDTVFNTPRTDTRCWYERYPNLGQHAWGDANTEYMRILSNGNVGVGLSNPNAILEVNATTTKPIISAQASDASLLLTRINGTRVSPAAISINNYIGVLSFRGQYSTTVGQTIQGASVSAIASGNWASTTAHPTLLSFTVSPNSGAEYEAMRIMPSGNVGINTVNPTSKLTVVRDNISTATINGDVMVFGDDSALYGARGNNSGVEFFMGVSSLGEAFLGSTTNHPMSLRTNNLQRLFIKNTGEIGIGNVAPTEVLDVTGNILASGNIVSGGEVKGVSFRTTNSATNFAFMGHYFLKKIPINTLSTAISVSSEVGTVPHETKHYLTSAGGTDRMEIYVGKILSGEIALVPTIKIENSPAQSLVTLKGDVLINKNAEIRGNLISKLDTTNIETGIKIFEVAKTINCNLLNNEVTLFTVPAGKQCKIGGDSGPHWSMFYNTITTALTVAPELTVTWYDISGSLTTYTLYPGINKDWYNFNIICSPVIGPGVVKLKVTIAATGSAVTSFMISTKIMYK